MAKKRISTDSGTYYIGRDLLKRMRAIGKRVNWSMVARDAFEAKCDEMEGAKTELQRLREEIEKLKARER